MPEIPDVATLTTISADWGNQIRSRTVQRYSSVSNRTTEHPSPTEGDLAYLEDSNTVWVYDGAAWVELFSGTIDTADITNSAVTSAKIADATIVAGDLAASVTQNLIAASGNVNTSSSALTASFVDKASVVFTKPASWATFRIIAWGSAILGGLSAGAVGEARVEIGAAAGSTFAFPSGANDVSIGCFHVADGSTNLTVATACRAASGSGNHLNSYVAYTAYRLT